MSHYEVCSSETTLRESEKRWKSLVQNAPTFITIVNRQYIIEYINHPVQGLKLDDVIGHSVYEFVQPEYHDIVRKSVESVFATGKPACYESTAVGPDGMLATYESHLSPVIVDKTIVEVSFFGIDITKRKRAENALRESEQRLRVAADSLDGILEVFDAESRILLMRGRKLEALGFKPDQMVGTTLYDFFRTRWSDHPSIKPFKEALSGKVVTVETTREGICFSTVLSPMKNERGETIGVVSLSLDVTERKRTEELLQNIQKIESLGILAGGIAHDFNNLLGGLFGYLDLARESITRDIAAKEYVESALHCLTNTTNLTRQLLTFAKGGAPHKKPVEIESIIQESVKLSFSGSNIQCEKNIHKDIYLINADHSQINQVFNNLFLNARQAMPNGGTVTVNARNRKIDDNEIPDLTKGTYVSVTVRDQGTGIPPDQISRVFDPFYTTKQTGSGLGLSMTYSIMRKHGGTVAIESEMGTGTLVTVVFPAITHQTADTPHDSGNVLKGEGRILVMDDNQTIRDVVCKLLHSAGFDPAGAANGEEAIALYEHALKNDNKFIVVILDLTVIGGMGGERTIRKLLEIDPQLKALVSSGYSDSAVFSNPKEYGFLGRIEKPYVKDALLKVLGEVINNPT